MLYSNRDLLSPKLRTILCEALVLSHFNYCSYVYGPFLDVRDRERIQRVQNTCCRLIFGLRKYDHVSLRIRELKWLNMCERRDFLLGVFVHKIMCTRAPSYLREKLVVRNAIHNVNTRHNGALDVPRHTTAIRRKCFTCQATLSYNKISLELKELQPDNFKYNFKKYLLNK